MAQSTRQQDCRARGALLPGTLTIVAVETLGADLVLLAVQPDGKVAESQRLALSLMGSELVRLAAGGKVDIADGRIAVRDAAPAGDAQLDQALQSLVRARRPPTAKTWVSKPRPGILDAYLAGLSAAGVLHGDSDAAVHAATDAATQAAVSAATHAAIHAAVHATAATGSHGGAAGGHGH